MTPADRPQTRFWSFRFPLVSEAAAGNDRAAAEDLVCLQLQETIKYLEAHRMLGTVLCSNIKQIAKDTMGINFNINRKINTNSPLTLTDF